VIYTVDRDLRTTTDRAPLPIITQHQALRVDERALVDATGQPLTQDAEVWEDPSGEVHSRVTLRPNDQRALPSEELEDLYLLSHPDRTAAELWAAKESAALPQEPPPIVVETGLIDWRSTASEVERIDTVVVLREQPALALPKPESEFGMALVDQTLPDRRASAIEQRKVLTRSLQQPFVEEVERLGGDLLRNSWSINRFEARLTPAALDAMAHHDGVARIEVLGQYEDDSNSGIAIRHATQVNQLLAATYNGDSSSGRNPAYSGIIIGVMDASMDEDHPALSYNLNYWQTWDDTLNEFRDPVFGETSADGTYSHGNGVLSQLLADGTQDSSLSPTDALERSGQTDGSSLIFFQHWDRTVSPHDKASRTTRMEALLEANVDVANMSASLQSLQCDTSHSENYAVDDLYLDDTFIVNTPGNNDNTTGLCSVNVPGTAAGSFTPGAYKRNASNLNTAGIRSFSPRGNDGVGRAMIDLIAPAGRELDTSSAFDDDYELRGVGTSFAAPVIAGSAANVKDMMIDVWGSGTANHVGNLYATMLLMGDGQTEAGPKRDTTNPQMDELWGAGRLRLRMWGADGLDAPHKTGLTRTNLDDGAMLTRGLNMDGGTNLPLPAEVDKLTAAVWWFEPNLLQASASADILVQVCNELNTCYDSGSTAPEPRRVFVPSPGGHTWEVRVTGLNIPGSGRPNYLYLQTQRTIHLAYMWEDSLRDDANGPTCFDEIDMSCTVCCNQPGALCVPSDC